MALSYPSLISSDLSLWRRWAALGGGLPRRGGGTRGDQAGDRAVRAPGQHGHLQRRHLQRHHLQAGIEEKQGVYYTDKHLTIWSQTLVINELWNTKTH